MKRILSGTRARMVARASFAAVTLLSAGAMTSCTSNDASVQTGDTTSVALPAVTSTDTTQAGAVTAEQTIPPGGAAPAPPSSTPPVATADGFHNENGQQVYDARKSIDLTGDGHVETVVVHARGATVDKAAVQLTIRDASGKSLYSTGWNTESYFKYSPRAGMSATAASTVVLNKLNAVLADSAFSRKSAKPDRDAIHYDLKEAAVRAKHSLSPDAPLSTSQLDEMEGVVVADSAIDAIVKDVTGMPTFTYHAGGELTYTVAWSKSKQRFVRIFSCC